MRSTDRLAKAIQKQKQKPTTITYGQYAGAETVDPNLSLVTIRGGNPDGSDVTLRYVPKGAHVTSLTTGDTVMIAGSPLCIIARVVGDITLA